VLVPYDPGWPERFRAAAADIRRATGTEWPIEHIGSTAIPGLVAKPIIDLAVCVPELTAVDEHRAALAGVGFLPIAAGPRTHRVLVRMSGRERTHIAHFFAADQWETCNQRIFRDWLNTHPADRAKYEQVKIAAAADATGRDYTARKTAVVQEIVDRARAESGLPGVDVWDK
jgi:GrpB-like predicted nucleotidyltransferase (UPF0157 family)